MALLALGVVFGYGGAFASFRHHAYECHSRWEQNEGAWRNERLTPAAAPAPVVVQAPAAPAAAAPQIFIIMPGASQAVPAVVVPATTVAPAAKTE
jgi:hypothetical protein